MIAIQMIHLQRNGRSAEVALVEAVGGKLYVDSLDNVWSVFGEMPPRVADPNRALEILCVPKSWREISPAEVAPVSSEAV